MRATSQVCQERSANGKDKCEQEFWVDEMWFKENEKTFTTETQRLAYLGSSVWSGDVFRFLEKYCKD
jgi:hypothetical protein